MFAQLKNRFVLWREYRDTLRQLRVLHDSTLSDIGIPRADMKRRARGGLPLRGL